RRVAARPELGPPPGRRARHLSGRFPASLQEPAPLSVRVQLLYLVVSDCDQRCSRPLTPPHEPPRRPGARSRGERRRHARFLRSPAGDASRGQSGAATARSGTRPAHFCRAQPPFAARAHGLRVETLSRPEIACYRRLAWHVRRNSKEFTVPGHAKTACQSGLHEVSEAIERWSTPRTNRVSRAATWNRCWFYRRPARNLTPPNKRKSANISRTARIVQRHTNGKKSFWLCSRRSMPNPMLCFWQAAALVWKTRWIAGKKADGSGDWSAVLFSRAGFRPILHGAARCS